MVSHNFAKDGAQGAGTKRVVIGDRQVMLATGLCGQTTVRAKLPDTLIAESTAQGLFQVSGGKVAR
jgi:hypothetical protein